MFSEVGVWKEVSKSKEVSELWVTEVELEGEWVPVTLDEVEGVAEAVLHGPRTRMPNLSRKQGRSHREIPKFSATWSPERRASSWKP